jgi:hypothetical protein
MIGKFVLSFGSFESTICSAILLISKKYLHISEKKALDFLIFLISKNSLNDNIEILKYLIEYFDLKPKDEWREFVRDTKDLQQKRNIYAHNFYGIDKKTLIKKTIKKKEYKWEEFDSETIEKDLNLLNERYRQLFDSVIENDISEDFIYISKYPRLFF